MKAKPEKLNAAWHKSHRMPKNPTPEQRLEWHLAHAQACGCRPVPPSLAAQLRAAVGKRRS
jgi:hypothetical protein